MLTIVVPAYEEYDESQNLFHTVEAKTLKLEHSLVSISKWESKWHKPFAVKEKRTAEETLDYIKCMVLDDDVSLDDLKCIIRFPEIIESINNYIDDPMTATTFSSINGGKPNREIITSEIVYYWMVANNIPFECQYWHLNKLLTLIKVCNIKNSPPKKMSQSQVAAQYKAINEARRKKWNTRG